MKKYLLFTYNSDGFNEPSGGWHDFFEAFDDLEFAKKIGRYDMYNLWHVVDRDTQKIVAYHSDDPDWKPIFAPS